MDPTTIQAMFRFNSWANEQLRQALQSTDEDRLRRPLDMWFGSVFTIFVHISRAEAQWLSRLCGATSSTSREPAIEPIDVATLVETWRDMDAKWESYVASLSSKALAETVTMSRRDGGTATYPVWQPMMQIAFHSTEHRGHATVALTQLGIGHGPQDFLDQFRVPAGG